MSFGYSNLYFPMMIYFLKKFCIPKFISFSRLCEKALLAMASALISVLRSYFASHPEEFNSKIPIPQGDSPFLSLPRPIQAHVLSFLDFQDVLSASLVCKQFAIILNSSEESCANIIWKNISVKFNFIDESTLNKKFPSQRTPSFRLYNPAPHKQFFINTLHEVKAANSFLKQSSMNQGIQSRFVGYAGSSSRSHEEFDTFSRSNPSVNVLLYVFRHPRYTPSLRGWLFGLLIDKTDKMEKSDFKELLHKNVFSILKENICNDLETISTQSGCIVSSKTFADYLFDTANRIPKDSWLTLDEQEELEDIVIRQQPQTRFCSALMANLKKDKYYSILRNDPCWKRFWNAPDNPIDAKMIKALSGLINYKKEDDLELICTILRNPSLRQRTDSREILDSIAKWPHPKIATVTCEIFGQIIERFKPEASRETYWTVSSWFSLFKAISQGDDRETRKIVEEFLLKKFPWIEAQISNLRTFVIQHKSVVMPVNEYSSVLEAISSLISACERFKSLGNTLLTFATGPMLKFLTDLYPRKEDPKNQEGYPRAWGMHVKPVSKVMQSLVRSLLLTHQKDNTKVFEYFNSLLNQYSENPAFPKPLKYFKQIDQIDKSKNSDDLLVEFQFRLWTEFRKLNQFRLATLLTVDQTRSSTVLGKVVDQKTPWITPKHNNGTLIEQLLKHVVQLSPEGKTNVLAAYLWKLNCYYGSQVCGIVFKDGFDQSYIEPLFHDAKDTNMHILGPSLKLLYCFNIPEIDARLKKDNLLDKAKGLAPNRQW